jgi:hypothetical protein
MKIKVWQIVCVSFLLIIGFFVWIVMGYSLTDKIMVGPFGMEGGLAGVGTDFSQSGDNRVGFLFGQLRGSIFDAPSPYDELVVKDQAGKLLLRAPRNKTDNDVILLKPLSTKGVYTLTWVRKDQVLAEQKITIH